MAHGDPMSGRQGGARRASAARLPGGISTPHAGPTPPAPSQTQAPHLVLGALDDHRQHRAAQRVDRAKIFPKHAQFDDRLEIAESELAVRRSRIVVKAFV